MDAAPFVRNWSALATNAALSDCFGVIESAPAKSMSVSPAPFEAGVLEFASKLRAFVRKRVASERDAEDITQEVFLKVFRARGALRDESKLEAWLYRTARSTIIDYYRRRRPTEELPVMLTEESTEFDDVAERLKRSVRRFLATLPEHYRRPMELSEFDGLTAREIAKKLGLTETATKSRLTRGRAMLREKLVGCCHFEFDSFGKIIDLKQRAPCVCDNATSEARMSGSSTAVTYALAAEKDESAIRALLTACDLPTADLTAASFLNFFVAKSGGRVIGCAGVEPLGKLGLLRSLAVADGYRRGGVGTRLIAEIERLARQLGIDQLYLLTATAEPLFASLGYARVPRSSAPTDVKRTREFAELCTHCATVMQRSL